MPAASIFGQAVALTAAVSPSAATGKVIFYDETGVLGSATLTNGAAALSTVGIGYGQRHITARYIGDANYSPSLSAAVVETVTTNPGGTFLGQTGLLQAPIAINSLTPIAATDLNHDGYPDLIAVNGGYSGAASTVSVFLNNGDGTFAAAVPYLPGDLGAQVAVGDVDLDGNPDLVISLSTSGIYLLKGKGDGTFPVDSVIQLSTEAGEIKIADLNSDAFPDLVLTRTAYGGSQFGGSQTVSVLLGNGDGTFQALPDFQAGATISDFLIGDFNRDGIPDLAITTRANLDEYSVSVFPGNGDGTFGAPTVYSTDAANSIAAADVNHDGIMDLVTGDSVLLGNAAGAFDPPISSAPGVSDGLILINDIDGDGNADIVSPEGISFGHGDGTFAPPVPAPVSAGVLADFNHDGIPDAASTAAFPAMGISIYNGALAPVLSLAAAPNPVTAGQPVNLTVTASRADATGTVTFFDYNSSQVSQTTVGTTALVNGSATVQQAQAPRGDNSFWATYSGDSKYGATQTPRISVVGQQAGPSLTLTASPNPALAGQPVTLTAKLGQYIGNAQIEFFDNGTPINTQTLYSAQAAYTATLAAGTHQLGAEVLPYGGLITAPASPVVEQVTDAAGGQLNPGPSYPSGGLGPGALAAGDFNGDGLIDLAVANTTGQSVSFFLGTKSGVYSAPVTMLLGFTPGGLAAGQGRINAGESFSNLLVTDPADKSVLAITFSTAFVGPPGLGTGSPVAGTQPVAVAAADFDSDGGSDIITANAGSNDVSILLSSASPKSLAAGRHPDAIVTGDFNQDGQADFAVANRDDNDVMVFTGNGDGTFQTPVTIGVGGGPVAIAAADLNGDGKADLAVADGQSGQVTILLGNGDGTFRNFATYASGPGSTSIAAAIFGVNQYPALVVTTSTGLLIFSGNGDGTFNPPVNYPQYAGGASVAVGTFSDDNRMEIAVSLPAANSVEFLYNDAATTAALSASPASGVVGSEIAFTVSITAAAFGWVTVYDGIAPIGSAIVMGGQGVVSTSFLSPGTHSISARFVGKSGYAPSVTPAMVFVVASPGSVGLLAPQRQVLAHTAVNLLPGDFNNDGKPDFVFYDGDNGLITLLGRGDGTFQETVSGATGGSPAVAADFNNDGNTDVATLLTGYPFIFFGDGNGTFVQTNQAAALTNSTVIPIAADLNRDGQADLILADTSGSVDVLLGFGNGTFQQSNFAVGANLTAVASGDVNGDGIPDVLVAAASGTLTAALGRGDGTFLSTQATAIAAAPVSIATADFNGDHHLDAAIVHSQGNLLSVLLGNGDGTFSPTATFSLGGSPVQILEADMNGDGNADLVVMFSTGNPAFAVLYGNGNGTFQSPVNYTDSYTPIAVAVSDVNGDGRLDVVLAEQGAAPQFTPILSVFPGAGIALSLNQGAGQSAAVGTAFPQALKVNAPAGTAVVFAAPSSGPGGSFAGTGTTATVTADSSGIATAPVFTANGVAGADSVTVSASGALGVLIPLTNNPGPPAGISGVGGAGAVKTTVGGTAFTSPFEAVVTDSYGNPVPNAAVIFAAPASGASLTFAGSGTNTATVTTNSSGIAISPQATANSTTGTFSLTATVSGTSLSVSLNAQNIVQSLVKVVIEISPVGPAISVDGTVYMDSQYLTFRWNAGDTHTISVTNLTQSLSVDTQYAFTGWSDGGAATHTITVPSSPENIIANFQPQIELVTYPGAGGTISPATGYYNLGSLVVTAIPNPGYAFTGFSGALTGTKNPQTMYLGFPTSVSADFRLVGPSFAVALTRSGSLAQGEVGATYTINISNPSLTATNGALTVVENLPAGLTLVSMSGLLWTCTGSSCTPSATSGPLPPGGSYEPIVVTVNVAANAPSQIINQVTVSGGGASSVTASDTAAVGALQTIAFGPINSLTFGAGPFTVSASATSGLAVSFASAAPTVCTVSGTTVTIIGGGVCSITATQAGSTNFGAANPVTQSFVVNPTTQTVTFIPPAHPTAAPSVPVPLTATASSGLPVYFSANASFVCDVNYPSVYLDSDGPCTITATQPGNASYMAASVTQTFIVGAIQNITFNPVGSVPAGAATVTLTATTTSGLPVSFVSNTLSICTVSGNTVTVIISGTCSVTANQPGDSTYGTAPSVTQTFSVTAALMVQPAAAFLDQNGAPALTFNNSTNFPDAGGFLIGAPGVAQAPDGDTYIVGLDGAGGVHLNSYSYANAAWNGWQYSGGILDTTSGLTAAVAPNGVVWFTGRDIGNRYWINSWNGTSFGGWILLDQGILSTDSIPQIAISSDGSVYVVGKDIGGRVWSNSYQPSNQTFTGWVDRQGIIVGQPSVTAGQDGMVYVAVRSVSSESPVYVMQLPASNGAGAAAFLSGGGQIDTDPQIVSVGGTVYIAAMADGGTVYLDTFSEMTQTFGGWTFTNGILSDITIADQGGNVYIAGRDSADRIYWYSASENSFFFAGGAGVSSTVLTGGK